jgi:hypothetical protein
MFFCFSVHSYAQLWSGVLDPSRAIDWSQAGVLGGIPNRTTVCATPSLTSGSGAASANATAINSAISSCGGSNQVVSIPAGTWYIGGSGLLFQNTPNVTLRGAGPDQTFLLFTAGNMCHTGMGGDICIVNSSNPDWGGGPGNTANWNAGYAVGSTSITLSSKSNLQVGSLLILDQLDDSGDTGNVYICQTQNVCSTNPGSQNGRPGRGQDQVVTVTSISGAGPYTVGITPGIYMPNVRAGQSPGAWWDSNLPITGVGIEDISLDHSASSIAAGTFLYNVYGCWLKNVRDVQSNHKHVWFYQSVHNTVRDSYFYGTQNASSESYGTEVYVGSDNLVENNIFQHVAVPMMNEGSTGFVGAYNFNVDDYYTAGGNAPLWQMGGSFHHSVGDAFILWEGNQDIGQMSDDIHGTSHFITSFRNYWNGRDTNDINGKPTPKQQQTNPVQLEAFSRYYNIVGNVLGTIGYHTRYQSAATSATDQGNASNSDVSIYTLGYSGNEGTYSGSSIPNDTLVAATLLRWGNYDNVNGSAQWNSSEVPSGLKLYANSVPANHNLPVSFYLSAQPSWWGSVPWPAIGPDVSGGNIANANGHANYLPAGNCYLNVMGGKTDGTSPVLTFNANNCYSGNGSQAPTNLKATVH